MLFSITITSCPGCKSQPERYVFHSALHNKTRLFSVFATAQSFVVFNCAVMEKIDHFPTTSVGVAMQLPGP